MLHDINWISDRLRLEWLDFIAMISCNFCCCFIMIESRVQLSRKIFYRIGVANLIKCHDVDETKFLNGKSLNKYYGLLWLFMLLSLKFMISHTQFFYFINRHRPNVKALNYFFYYFSFSFMMIIRITFAVWFQILSHALEKTSDKLFFLDHH